MSVIGKMEKNTVVVVVVVVVVAAAAAKHKTKFRFWIKKINNRNLHLDVFWFVARSDVVVVIPEVMNALSQLFYSLI